MNNKLPKVFVNESAQDLKVNQEDDRISNRNSISLDSVLDDSNKYLFLHKYNIKLKDKVINSSIISKTGDYILTIDGDKINIKDIIDIEEIKK